MFSFLKPPVFNDETQARPARLLHVILLAFMLILTPLFLLQAVFAGREFSRWLALILAIDGLIVALLVINRRGRVRLVSLVTVSFAWFYVLAASLASGGSGSQVIWFYLVVVLFAGILMGGRAGMLTGLACSLTTLGVWLAEAAGFRLPSVVTDTRLDFWLVFVSSLVSVTLLQYLATRSIRESLDQANHELAVRRQAELRRSESEQKFRSLVERSTDGILLLDEQGRIIEYNQALALMTGIPCEQAQGMTGWDYQYLLMLPEVQNQVNYERIRSAFERVIQTGQVLYPEQEIESSFRRADGQNRAVAQKVFTIPTERGFRVAAISRDVTERKQAEDALRQSQAALSEINETLRAIVDGSPAAINMMDLDGNMQLWNPASERVFGWTAKEVLGKPNPIIPPERREEYSALNQQLFQNGKISEFETQRQRKDGTLIDISLSSAVIRDALGCPRASMAIIADITERRRAEKELVESSRRLNTTINNLRGVVYRCANDMEWTMEYISDGILDLAGYPAEDFIANRVRSFSSIIEPEDQAKVWNDIQRALIRRQPYTLEYRIRTASGEQKWAWERGRGVFEGDQLVALEGFISNITDRKKAEEEAIIEQRRLNSLLHITQKKTESVSELLDCALDEITALTGSPFGYIFFYNEEKQEFTLHNWSKKALEACAIPEPPTVYPLETTGIWGEVVRQGGPVLLNNFQDPHPLKKGFPAGHAPIFRFMSLPVIDGERIVATVGVANKPTDYTDLDLRQLDMMMDSIWKIAERKQAETALRESELKFRALIEQNSEGVVLTDEQGSIIEWNQAMARITGLAQADVLGKPTWEVLLSLVPVENRTPARAEKLRSYLSEALRNGNAGKLSQPVEVTIHRPDGERVLIQQIVFPIKTALGYRLGSLTGDITESKRSQQQIQALNADLLAAYDATIEGWAAALELRDQETEGHSQRVVELTVDLARRTGFPEADLIHLRRGAILHDIGKMGIPDSILLKPGPLTGEEWESMRQHPRYAFVMLLGIPYLRPAIDIPYSHHERWDGSGYPRGLQGEDIPLAARIFAVIDVWDALLSNRPYRTAWPHAEVVRYLEENAGIQFDPKVVKAFLEMMKER